MNRLAIPNLLKSFPGVQTFAESARGQAFRHRVALHFENRKAFTFTQFLRLPSQLDALCGPVLEFVRPHDGTPVRIAVIGCSNGAEPYTIASILLQRRPDIAFTIDAYDIDPDVLRIARAATYSADEVFANPFVTPEFVAHTFDQGAAQLAIKSAIAQRVRFHLADATDAGASRLIAPADMVFSQNVMCNLQRRQARRFFDNVAALLKPRSALFLAGMDLDMREQRTRRQGLVPLAFALERIHDEARLVLGERYPWHAAGLEPYSRRKRNLERRYSTIFLRGCESASKSLD
ncbi:MAG: CheR family methyltransferase [Rhodanobacteraceae bacterium]